MIEIIRQLVAGLSTMHQAHLKIRSTKGDDTSVRPNFAFMSARLFGHQRAGTIIYAGVSWLEGRPKDLISLLTPHCSARLRWPLPL